jgi:hypothetical protein
MMDDAGPLTAGEDQDELLAKRILSPLGEVPDLDPARHAEMRTRFMEQAEAIGQPVSQAGVGRRNRWRLWTRKETPMFNLVRIMIVLALLIGGGGTSAAFAAQSSLPGDALYPLKISLEEMRLGLTNDAQAEIALLGELVSRRLQEIQAALEEGLPVAEQLQTRLENHLQLALQFAAELEDPALIKAMEQIRIQSEQQLRLVQQLRQNAPLEQEQALQQTERTILRVQSMAEGALLDPTTFRLQLGVERPDTAPDQPQVEPTGNQDQDGGQNGPGSSNQGKGGQP